MLRVTVVYSRRQFDGVGRGERDYVLGARNIFLLRSAKQEREAKFGARECGNANPRTRKKLYTGTQERGNAKAKSRNAERKAFQERTPVSA